jgi:hypothetical protein
MVKLAPSGEGARIRRWVPLRTGASKREVATFVSNVLAADLIKQFPALSEWRVIRRKPAPEFNVDSFMIVS